MNILHYYSPYDTLLLTRRKEENIMAVGRPVPPITLSPEIKRQLEAIAHSRSFPHGLVRRAKIVLMASEGMNNITIAQKIGLSAASVGMWRKRFLDQGLPGLYDEMRPGGPRSISDEQIARLIRKTLKTKPKDGTHWTCRTVAEETKISKSTVHRVWRAFGIQPHRQKHFKLSTDPFFVEKVRDIVGLYLNPPDKAMVLCVDEKSQIQALDRVQPVLPMGLGYVEGVTHDYIRHGTTTLFAALDIASGHVLTQCKPRHRHQEFLQFLRHIGGNVPEDLDIHLVVDNYVTHKHAKVRRWLASRPRYHIHYTPTYSSWLNQVEIWFNIITQRAIRRGTFRIVRDLINSIERFVEKYNTNSRPFMWTATADSILEKIERLCKGIAGTGN
jgi:putative transposase